METYEGQADTESLHSGYYDEYGEWQWQPIIDEQGRLIDPSKTDEEEDPYAVEDYDTFISAWQKTRIVTSVSDAAYASSCIWPDCPSAISLKRFDVYETDLPSYSQLSTSTLADSLKIRWNPNYRFKMAMFFVDHPITSITKELLIESAAAPKRSRYRPIDKKNHRDLTSWSPSEKLYSYCSGINIRGTKEYFVDWQDAPDRYSLNVDIESSPGWRRMFRFAAYPVTQFYVLMREVRHDILRSEGGTGKTYVLERGPKVYAYKDWRLLCSFYAFDRPLPSSQKYTVYETHEPFLRMNMSLGDASHPEDWPEKFSFYAFDIPLAGSAPLQLQHTIRSIHTTAAGVNRHRLSTDDPILPWQFRFTVFVFPVTLEECIVSTNPADVM